MAQVKEKTQVIEVTSSYRTTRYYGLNFITSIGMLKDLTSSHYTLNLKSYTMQQQCTLMTLQKEF